MNSMLLVDSIQQDIQNSLKKGDKVRVDTLRFLLSAIRNEAIAKYGASAQESITDEDVLGVIKKQVKTRKESVLAFRQANRMELVQKEEEELEILQAFLPQELSDEEIKTLLLPVANSTETNFGLLMKQAMGLVKGKADGGRVSTILREITKKS